DEHPARGGRGRLGRASIVLRGAITETTRRREPTAYTTLANRTVEPNRLPERPALHAHRVVPRVDVERRRRHIPCVVRQEVRGGGPDVVGGDVAVERSALLDDCLHRRKAGDRARGERPDGAGRHG